MSGFVDRFRKPARFLLGAPALGQCPSFFAASLPSTDMPVTERIAERVRRLPERAQAEVLDFVEFLLAKLEREAARSETAEQETTRQEERAWNQFSLSSAMRGMEDEDGPNYTEDDLKEHFS